MQTYEETLSVIGFNALVSFHFWSKFTLLHSPFRSAHTIERIFIFFLILCMLYVLILLIVIFSSTFFVYKFISGGFVYNVCFHFHLKNMHFPCEKSDWMIDCNNQSLKSDRFWPTQPLFGTELTVHFVSRFTVSFSAIYVPKLSFFTRLIDCRSDTFSSHGCMQFDGENGKFQCKWKWNRFFYV